MVKARRRGGIPGAVMALFFSLASVPAEPLVARKPPETFAELIPPPVPEAENAAKLYLQAAALLAEQKLQGTPLAQVLAVGELRPAESLLKAARSVCELKADDREELHTTLLEEFGAYLRTPQVKKALALVEQASRMPHCRFRINYEAGLGSKLPHLTKLRSLGRFLTATALAEAEAGEMETAWTRVRQQWQLADHLRGEPTLISQLVRFAVFAIADKGMKELAVAGPPTAKIARALDQLLDRVEDPEPWAAAMHGERLLLDAWVFRLPAEEFAVYMARLDIPQNAEGPALELLATDYDVLQRVLLRATELLEQPYYRAKTPLAETMAELNKPDDPNPFGEFVPALDALASKLALLQARARVARIGLRLKAYRAKHGNYPATLAVLDLPDIPDGKRIDPFTGRALIYRAEGKGFVLYSFGADAIDNGGKERQSDEKSGFDIVWRAKR